MIVNSHNIEFGYELISALPYAYYLYLNGKLDKTISGTDTKCLYYFSPDHEENTDKRSWYNTPKAVKIPNIDIHKPFLYKSQFAPPPLKEHYKNTKYKFRKETVVICNRINREWGENPINFFDCNTLDKLFSMLEDKYQVIYINIEGRPELYDNESPISINDKDILKKHPKVIDIHNLKKKTKVSFNELQLKIFANCEKFITMNGGHSILASYFGGENIIMSKYGKPQTREINKENNSFYRWYDQFGDSRVMHVPNESRLLRKVRSLWINHGPICNILVRTANRPNAFNRCIASIEKQNYENINILVSYQNAVSFKYIVPQKVYAYKVSASEKIKPSPQSEEYGVRFVSNLYINDLQDKVKEGFVIILDDDDRFTGKDSISKVSEHFRNNKKPFVLWRVKIGNRMIPGDANWKKKPVCCDISGIGFAFHIDNKIKWEPYKRGDFRVAKQLYKNIRKKVWINEVLTQTQMDMPGMGRMNDVSGRYRPIVGLPKRNDIYNYINKGAEIKVKKHEKIEGQKYNFIMIPSNNISDYVWDPFTRHMITKGMLKEVSNH